MGKYTKEEIKVFEDKELRIVRQAIMKKLIEKCKLEDVYGVIKVIELTEKYVDHVYSEREDNAKRDQAGCVASSTEGIEAKPTSSAEWEQIAQGLNIAIPNSQNVKILNQVADEYKKAHKAIVNPSLILVSILDTFGRYPTKTESVSKVIDNLKG